jgi:hypothetical protein
VARTYRPGLTEFRLTHDIEVARSIARANPQFGAGGLEQFYIPNFGNVTEPVVSTIMKNQESSHALKIPIDPAAADPDAPCGNLVPLRSETTTTGGLSERRPAVVSTCERRRHVWRRTAREW